MKKHLFYLVGLAVFIAACKKSDPTPTPTPPKPVPPTVPTSPYVVDNSFKIIAYVQAGESASLIPDSKYKMITHLLYAFLAPKEDASGDLRPLPAQANFDAFKAKAKANNVKFGIAVGFGGSVTESTYLTIAQSSVARAKFVKNIVDFAKANKLDGVDMDWEYPRDNNGGTEAFHSLMQELSVELHKVNMFLSAAVTPAVYGSTNRLGIATKTFQYMDFVNIMQYDGAGYDSAEPLNHASYKMSVNSLNYWLGTRGLDKSKAIVGMPLYGKDVDGKSLIYKTIEASGADVNLNTATINGISYGFNGIPVIKQKAQLAKDRANGIMFWSFGQDSHNANSLLKAANDALGRSY